MAGYNRWANPNVQKKIGDYFKENKDAYGSKWEAYKKANPLKHEICNRCTSRSNLQRHHLISPIKWPEGVDRKSNIEILCKDCHNKTHGRRF